MGDKCFSDREYNGTNMTVPLPAVLFIRLLDSAQPSPYKQLLTQVRICANDDNYNEHVKITRR